MNAEMEINESNETYIIFMSSPSPVFDLVYQNTFMSSQSNTASNTASVEVFYSADQTAFAVGVHRDDHYMLIRENGYVPLASGTPFALVLQNRFKDRRASAKIEINGQAVGDFAIDANSTATICRPDHENKQFIALAVDDHSSETKAVKGDSKNGLIQIRFRPEKPAPPTHKRHLEQNVPQKKKYRRPNVDDDRPRVDECEYQDKSFTDDEEDGYEPESCTSTPEVGEAIVALGSATDQTFHPVYLDLDEDAAVEMNLRIVQDKTVKKIPVHGSVCSVDRTKRTAVPPPVA